MSTKIFEVYFSSYHHPLYRTCKTLQKCLKHTLIIKKINIRYGYDYKHIINVKYGLNKYLT